jgi:pilus assembly protein Flp/PilA
MKAAQAHVSSILKRACALDTMFHGSTLGINRRAPMFSALKSLVRNQSGATAIEYGLIASLIALVIIASVGAVGTKMTGTFNKVAGNLH